MLNCLIFAEFTNWKQQNQEAIIDIIDEMIGDSPVEQNRILIAYNPIQTICLSCQLLNSIAKSVSLYAHRCHTTINDLQDLGSKIIDNFSDTDILE